MCADVNVVETVAHMMSAPHYFGDVDVICDIGGQDIKIILLKNGAVKDFKLNTQCSAGNGYFLQSVAQDFGVPVDQYADLAFKADRMPKFNYGCAVFLDSDRVNFQKEGYSKEEFVPMVREVRAQLTRTIPAFTFTYTHAIRPQGASPLWYSITLPE